MGNLRLAYRAGQRRTYQATLEQDNSTHARESHQFDSLSVSPPVAVPTGLARTGSYAARLNAGGSAPQPLGPLTQLAVQKGDTISVTAPGRYQQATNNSTFSLLSFVASLLQPAPAGTPPGLDGARRGGLPLLQVGLSAATLLALNQLPGGVPKGYLRVLSFNEDSVLVDQLTVQLSTAALGNYETLQTGPLVVQQNGYVSVYVGNESAADVYFDDVTIEHRQGLQVQENQYDPFGLDLAGVSGAAPGLRLKNFYQFNGKENQLDLGLNWNHHDARFYDYQLGRWHVVDPLVEAGQENWTPYQFGFNNPVRFNDPNGMKPQDDFFNKNGRFLKHTNTKTNNIYVGGKTFSSLDAKNTGERQAAANVVGHYAKKLGITGVGVAYNPKKPASENPALTTSKGKIYVNTNGGINPNLNNSNNLSNVLVHEKQHQDDFKSGVVNPTLLRHAEIYLKQAQDPSFGKGNTDWQNGQGVSFGRYIMSDMVNSVDGGTNAADTLLKSFNTTNTAGVQVKPNMANESISISNENKSYGPVKFEPVSD